MDATQFHKLLRHSQVKYDKYYDIFIRQTTLVIWVNVGFSRISPDSPIFFRIFPLFPGVFSDFPLLFSDFPGFSAMHHSINQRNFYEFNNLLFRVVMGENGTFLFIGRSVYANGI